jgi:hypothetical protein
MVPTPADLTYQLNAIITATRFRQGVAEEEIAAFVEGLLAAARATRQPAATTPETPTAKRKRKARK